MGRNKSRKSDVPLRSKLKKDPGVPRLPTLKQRNAEKSRAHASASVKNAGPVNPDPDSTMAVEPTLSSLAALAASAQSTSAFPSDPSSSTSFLDPASAENHKTQTKEQLRKHHVRALHKVIDESDIVLLVLDARDPEGCRSRLVEEEVRRRESEGKRLVFILNKIDLVPKDNAQAWLRYLRHNTPTLPFRSATNNQRNNLSSTTAPALTKLLKAYRPSVSAGGGKQAKQSVTVGVVGYPNVGKSSLINSLKRSKVCSVASTPGHTQTLQSIQLERGLKIVDSPGVVFDDADDQVDSAGRPRPKGTGVLLRNVVKVEDIEDPIALVEEILSRTSHETLMKIYNLPQIGSPLEFLTMLALVSGKLLKGGTPDILSAARVVLGDWNHHKIPFFSVPPTVHPSMLPSMTAEGQIRAGAEDVGQARILQQLAPAFSLPGFDLGGSDGAEAMEAADEDAFGDAPEEEMHVEDDQGGMEMDVADASMLSTSSVLSQKRARPRSVSPTPSAFSVANAQPARDLDTRERQPKRLRRSHDIPAYDAPVSASGLAGANPLNRRALKKAAKKARRADRPRVFGGDGGMEVDDEGMEGSFMDE
ncbi:nucleostemin-like domain-containing protein [Phanerochaete sordida]|uniref:Nucleostemin-like domain-containing protein n=1 Tax=Phanerochaete sordida TaxID=48140 RepID=A0A9P3GCB1_9APHY|nr:nucleostemin-like domain-containing protein [Phanerochaete sordida]